MADDGGLVQMLFADVAGDLLGHGGADRLGRIALRIGLRRGAREAGDVDAVDAIAPGQVIDRALPDVGRGRQAGDQDQIGRALRPVDADAEAVGGEGGVRRVVGRMVDVTVLSQGGRSGQQQGGGDEGG